MKTVEIEVTINSLGRNVVELVFPADLSLGRHKAVLIVDEILLTDQVSGEMPKKIEIEKVFSRYTGKLTDPQGTIRREDIYGNDGR